MKDWKESVEALASQGRYAANRALSAYLVQATNGAAARYESLRNRAAKESGRVPVQVLSESAEPVRSLEGVCNG